MSARGRRSLFTILVAFACSSAGAAHGSRHDPPNVRPFFDAGYSIPVEYGFFETGYGLGAGLEIEHTRHVSMLFRFEYNRLLLNTDALYPCAACEYAYYPIQRTTSTTWQLGVRGYLTRRGLRPYGELDFGVRLEGKHEASPYAYPSLFYTGIPRDSDLDGPVGAGRIGFSTARHGGAGLLLESGFEFVIRNPGDFALVPIRLGIVFP